MIDTEFVRIAKDIVLSAAAITGAVIAIKGLGAWRRQIKGQTEYDLARRILVSLFMYRDAIDRVRHPMMLSAEMPYPPEEKAKHMTDPQIMHHGRSHAYFARLGKVTNARKTLYADLLEAEALWSNELNSKFKTLYDLERELVTKIRHHLLLADPAKSEKHKKSISKIDNQARDIMYENLRFEDEEEDEYKMEFKSGIEAIESYLKSKLSGH